MRRDQSAHAALFAALCTACGIRLSLTGALPLATVSTHFAECSRALASSAVARDRKLGSWLPLRVSYVACEALRSIASVRSAC